MSALALAARQTTHPKLLQLAGSQHPQHYQHHSDGILRADQIQCQTCANDVDSARDDADKKTQTSEATMQSWALEMENSAKNQYILPITVESVH